MRSRMRPSCLRSTSFFLPRVTSRWKRYTLLTTRSTRLAQKPGRHESPRSCTSPPANLSSPCHTVSGRMKMYLLISSPAHHGVSLLVSRSKWRRGVLSRQLSRQRRSVHLSTLRRPRDRMLRHWVFASPLQLLHVARVTLSIGTLVFLRWLVVLLSVYIFLGISPPCTCASKFLLVSTCSPSILYGLWLFLHHQTFLQFHSSSEFGKRCVKDLSPVCRLKRNSRLPLPQSKSVRSGMDDLGV